MNEIKKGYVPNEVYKVEKFGNTFKLIDTSGNKLVLLNSQLGKVAYKMVRIQTTLTRMVKRCIKK